MEGYDRELPTRTSFENLTGSVVLIQSLVALPSFQQQFGVKLANGTYQLEAGWQSGVSESPILISRVRIDLRVAIVGNCGLIVGIFSNGWLIDRFGR